MFSLNFYHFVLGLTLFSQEYSAERRITGGAAVKNNSSTGYVVYLRESRKYETRTYKAPWICGGAIVTASHILTSAACVKNVEYLLAIAGTRKLETNENLKKCMNHMYVKRVVSICVPKKYKFNYTVENWIDNDIAVVEVETPYFFNYYRPDKCYQYSPRPIEVNYDLLNEKTGTDAVVFGWGHKYKYGTETDADKEGILNYAPVLVIDKEKCKNHYLNTPSILPVIDKEKICTFGSGNLNYEGRMYDKDLDEINPRPESLGKESCRKNANPGTLDEKNHNENTDQNGKVENGTISVQNTANHTMSSRRNHPSKDNINFKNLNIGICQNDHGGPLIRWSNRHEVLIGLASVFMNGDNDTCVGPFLYTSTASHRKFIECVTKSSVNPKFFRRSCDALNESGIEIYRRLISWDRKPIPLPELKPRAQVPINKFHFKEPETP